MAGWRLLDEKDNPPGLLKRFRLALWLLAGVQDQHLVGANDRLEALLAGLAVLP
jgi:hypothetical protein